MQTLRILIWVGLLVFSFAGSPLADIDTLKKECKSKCEAAAAMINTRGMAEAVCEINNPTGQFVNGEIYVYMMNMDAVMMAHPLAPSLIGKNLSGLVLKDIHGQEQPMMLVNFVKKQGAGWLSYMWPKPGASKPSEKICYLLKVPDTNVFLVAGFYRN